MIQSSLTSFSERFVERGRESRANEKGLCPTRCDPKRRNLIKGNEITWPYMTDRAEQTITVVYTARPRCTIGTNASVPLNQDKLFAFLGRDQTTRMRARAIRFYRSRCQQTRRSMVRFWYLSLGRESSAELGQMPERWPRIQSPPKSGSHEWA